MNIPKASLNLFTKVKKHPEAYKSMALVNGCRREGYVLNHIFYYRTPDNRCWCTVDFTYIPEPHSIHENYETTKPSLEEL